MDVLLALDVHGVMSNDPALPRTAIGEAHLVWGGL
jgi:hypothetical protein